ncbi:uncharacterized protein LOC141508321 [Macrotis lagotis]|uniref:uncharacterized protein LOC141508321 n=1 Tax=Macrotis lagotis TaxID=92651 RepID=UPI003D69FB97
MEFMWSHIFSELNTKPTEQALLVTGLLPSDKYSQEKITEIMMETFHVPSLHIGNQAELALFGSGLLTVPGYAHCTCSQIPFLFLIDFTFIFLMEEVSVVIDIGSDWCRAGPGGRNHPRIAVPEVIGYQSHPENPGPSNPPKRKIVGHINLPLLRQIPTEFLIQRGQVINWDNLETILKYTYDLLGLKTEDHPVLLTGFLSNENDRKKLIEVMMETFHVPSLYVGNHAELCLFGSGFLTGLVLHSGTTVTYITPVCNGRAKPLFTKIFEMAGLDVNVLLHKVLFNTDMNLNSLSQRYDMDIVKERLCYISKHPNQQGNVIDPMSNVPGVTVLPDGKVITLASEFRTFPDMFFWTAQHDLPNLELSSEVIETVMKCDSEEHPNLFSHVVLSGGNTLFSGFPERLLWELNTIRSHWFPAEVVSRPNRIYLSWVGGSILSRLSAFNSQYFTNKEYQEAVQTLTIK